VLKPKPEILIQGAKGNSDQSMVFPFEEIFLAGLMVGFWAVFERREQ
jgi:hypothetical protein